MEILTIEELNSLTRGKHATLDKMHENTDLVPVQDLWNQLLRTVHAPSVSDKHMTATCNAICFTVRALAQASAKNLSSFALSSDVWTQTFGAARAAFAAGKNKPALQVLDTLAFLAETNASKQEVSKNISIAVAEMVTIIFNQTPKKCLKEACIVLCFLLRRLPKHIPFSEILLQSFRASEPLFRQHCLESSIDLQYLNRVHPHHWNAFIIALLMAIRIAESKSATLKLLALLPELHEVPIEVDVVGMIDRALQIYGASNESALENVSKDILPSIITTKTQYEVFLTRQYSSSQPTEPKVLITLALLQFGVKKAFVDPATLPKLIHQAAPAPNNNEDGSTFDSSIENLLSNNSSRIRLKTCDLITFSTSPKAPVLPVYLTSLAQSLPYLHNDTDAFQRGELLSIFRRFLTRLLHSRHALSSRTDIDRDQDIQPVDSFFRSYIQFLVTELSPHFSYGRHILALDLITHIINNIMSITHTYEIWSQPIIRKLVRQLYRLVLDPYDDVRSTASQVLSSLRSEVIGENVFVPVLDALAAEEGILPKAIRHAAATNRADHADAIGRLLDLTNGQSAEPEKDLQQMVQKLAVFINQFVNTLEDFDTSTQYPLHAHILGITYIIKHRGKSMPANNIVKMSETLLAVCWGVWILSQPHLCIDSPEMENEILDEGESSGPKDQLAYAWRALRDSNLLMQAMLNHFSMRFELVKSIGQLCFDQLGSLRHRGAFSTVAQTFLLSCQYARASNDPQIVALLDDWFHQAMRQLEEQADKLTRRSAGLPAMFMALLNPHDRTEFMQSFEKLVQVATKAPEDLPSEISSYRLRLPQVHGLNCLKDIMTSSRFRTMTEPLVVPILNIAAKSMSSTTWAIKNCGLMLLRASINRLDPDTSLGASEAALNLKSTTYEYQTPFDIAILLLKSDESTASGGAESNITAGSIGEEAEFAGLDLVSRLYIRRNERELARGLVSRRLRHSLWHIRTQASRVLAGMTAHSIRVEEFIRRGKVLKCLKNPNDVHGHLLYLRELLPNLQYGDDWLQRIEEINNVLLDLGSTPVICNIQINQATWLEIVNQFCSSRVDSSEELLRYKERPNTPVLAGKGPDACALLDRSSGIFAIQNITSGNPEEQRRLSELLKKDDNATFYIMESACTLRTKTSGPAIVDAIYEVLLSSAASDTRATAVDAYILLNPTLGSNSKPDFDQISTIINFVNQPTRKYFKSQIILYAYTCAIAWSCGASPQELKELRILAPGFILHLRIAANEEVEDITRQAALDALSHLATAPNALVNISGHFGAEDTFEILSILYDLLNDDDDDHRTKACSSVSALLNGTRTNPSILETPCAAASRAQIMALMRSFAHEHGSEMLENECFRRLTGMRMEVPRQHLGAELKHYLTKDSIKQQVDVLLQVANDLFAEEKQNLYIDEVAEIRVWTMIAADVDSSMWTQRFTFWLEEGLKALMQVLAVPSRRAKLEFSLEFEVIIIRLVSIARALGLFMDRVADLQTKCSQAHLSESVVAVFAPWP